MTTQAPDILINRFPKLDFEGFDLNYILGPGAPGTRLQLVYQSTPDARKMRLGVNSGNWNGYRKVFLLGSDGRLTLDRFVYNAESDDIVQEPIEGDFWLVMLGPVADPDADDGDRAKVRIPFVDGVIVGDTSRWELETRAVGEEVVILGSTPFDPLMRLTGPQRLSVIATLVLVLVSLLYVPFEGEYRRESAYAHTSLGYHFLASPPSPRSICVSAFDIHPTKTANRYCSARPAWTQVAVSVTAVLVGGLIAFLLASRIRT